jgi:hypothetical protein
MALILQFLGLACAIIGAFLISTPVGFIIAGILLAVTGVAIERGADAQ